MVRSLALARGADVRGIALQTVIIIVVLLAIAGTVAGVLLTRGEQATTQLERTNVGASIYSFPENLCAGAGGTWVAPTAAAHVTAAAEEGVTLTAGTHGVCTP